jgi:hypothetical protein
VVRHHLKAGGTANRPAVRGTRGDLVEPAAVGIAGGPEDLGRHAEVEGDDVVESEDGDAMASGHGSTLTHVGLRASRPFGFPGRHLVA